MKKIKPWPKAKNINALFLDKHVKQEQLPKYIGRKTTLVTQKQTHSSKVRVIKSQAEAKKLSYDIREGDALVTNQSGVALVVKTADCIPLLAHGKTPTGKSIVGACHAGWRGVAGGIIEKWIGSFAKLGISPSSIHVAIGPAIGRCQFEVGKDVSRKLCRYKGKSLPKSALKNVRFPHKDPKKDFIDLNALARFRLKSLGVKAKNVFESGECTHCQPEHYASYRRDGALAGRMASVISLVDPGDSSF